MQIDWTISIGNIITVLFGIGTLISLYFAIRTDIRLIQFNMTTMGGRIINIEAELKKLSEVMTALAVQDTRQTAFDERLNVVTERLNAMQDENEEWKRWLRDRNLQS